MQLHTVRLWAPLLKQLHQIPLVEMVHEAPGSALAIARAFPGVERVFYTRGYFQGAHCASCSWESLLATYKAASVSWKSLLLKSKGKIKSLSLCWNPFWYNLHLPHAPHWCILLWFKCRHNPYLIIVHIIAILLFLLFLAHR